MNNSIVVAILLSFTGHTVCQEHTLQEAVCHDDTIRWEHWDVKGIPDSVRMTIFRKALLHCQGDSAAISRYLSGLLPHYNSIRTDVHIQNLNADGQPDLIYAGKSTYKDEPILFCALSDGSRYRQSYLALGDRLRCMHLAEDRESLTLVTTNGGCCDEQSISVKRTTLCLTQPCTSQIMKQVSVHKWKDFMTVGSRRVVKPGRTLDSLMAF
jgi:hypothetical protein